MPLGVRMSQGGRGPLRRAYYTFFGEVEGAEKLHERKVQCAGVSILPSKSKFYDISEPIALTRPQQNSMCHH